MRAAGADPSGRGVGFVRVLGPVDLAVPLSVVPSSTVRNSTQPNSTQPNSTRQLTANRISGRRWAARDRLAAPAACARSADHSRRHGAERGSTGRRGVGSHATDQSRGRTAHRHFPSAHAAGHRRTGWSTGHPSTGLPTGPGRRRLRRDPVHQRGVRGRRGSRRRPGARRAAHRQRPHPLARAGVRRVRGRAVRPRRDRTIGGGQVAGGGDSHRRRAADGPPRRGDRPRRTGDRPLGLARATPRAADAGVVSLRSAGRCVGRIRRLPCAAGRRSRPCTLRRTRRSARKDPASGRGPGPSSGS